MFISVRELEREARVGYWSSPGFEFENLDYPDYSGDAIYTSDSSQFIRIQATGPKLTLKFHTHQWCGAVFVETNGSSTRLDLYSEEHGFLDFDVLSDASTQVDVLIKCGAEPHSHAKDNQVWFVGADFSERQEWRPRSITVSEHTKLTHGEWGAFLSLMTDTVIGPMIVSDGIWAKEDVEFFKTVVRDGMVVLDIGANIGHHTVVYSKLVGESGYVLAFEPQKLIANFAISNLTINGCQNADVLRVALGAEEGTIHMYPIDYGTRTNFGALGVDHTTANVEEAPGETVMVSTVDNVINEKYAHFDRVDFMKIDVQSYELYVLKGATETIERFHPMIFLEIAPHWMKIAGYEYTEVYDFLRSRGYVFDHLDGTPASADSFKKWSGREGEEWDVFAYVPD